MSYLHSYKRLNRLIQNESFEPMISWGLRMAISGTLPLLWGFVANRLSDAIWIILASEAISWVELKGSFTWRVRTLLTGAFLAISFSLLGAITGANVWLSVVAMLVVGFLATLLKNIGDRASGLGLCVYLMFIICNAYPLTHLAELQHRMTLLAIGAAWPVFVGITISLLMPAQQPFRRQIALIWRAIAELAGAVTANRDNKSPHDIANEHYLKEKEVRAAIDSSYQFYGRMVHQVDKKDNQKYQLSLLRKTAGIVAANVIAIGDEMELIDFRELNESLRIKAGILFNALKEAVARISIFVITLNPEEKLLAVSHINRLRNLSDLIKQAHLPSGEQHTIAINRILHLTERIIKLLESAILRIDQMGQDKPVFRSYSLIKTSFIVKPKYLMRNVQVLFNFNTLTTHYALRSAIAAAVAVFIYKWFNVDHGYWLPFSVMIVIQPYFGATFKKSIDRVAGTLLGGLAGGLLLHVPSVLHIKEIILFLTFILMVYYLRRQYALAVFAITLNLVLLFNIEAAYNNMLLATRAICTIGGALLAIAAGVALLPTWDKKWLPSHLARAISRNYEYFTATFFAPVRNVLWTKNKRLAESDNSNVFDSFNRYMQEPGWQKTEVYYGIIMHSIRITRNLNNIHLEQDEKKTSATDMAHEQQQLRINECLQLFNNVLLYLPRLYPGISPAIIGSTNNLSTPFLLNDAQMISLEKLIIELKTMDKDLDKFLHSESEYKIVASHT